MKDRLQFISAFLRQPGKIGAIAPSSPTLAREMMRNLDVKPGQTVLEFGPGTGPFTAAILDALPDGAAYLGIELHPGFVAHLRQRFPQATFVQGSAGEAARHHAEHRLPPVRAILCGLPFASLPPSVQDQVIAALDQLLGPGAEFRTFQYVHAFGLPTAVRFRRRMADLLGPPTRSRAVVRNVPPAFVLRWSRPASAAADPS